MAEFWSSGFAAKIKGERKSECSDEKEAVAIDFLECFSGMSCPSGATVGQAGA